MLSFWHYDPNDDERRVLPVVLCFFNFAMFFFLVFSPYRFAVLEHARDFSVYSHFALQESPFGVKIMLFVVCCWLFIPSPPFIFFSCAQRVVVQEKKSRRALRLAIIRHKIECNFSFFSTSTSHQHTDLSPFHFRSRRSTVCLRIINDSHALLHFRVSRLSLFRAWCVDTLFREGEQFHW